MLIMDFVETIIERIEQNKEKLTKGTSYENADSVDYSILINTKGTVELEDINNFIIGEVFIINDRDPNNYYIKLQEFTEDLEGDYLVTLGPIVYNRLPKQTFSQFVYELALNIFESNKEILNENTDINIILLIDGDFFQGIDNCNVEAGKYTVSVDEFANEGKIIRIITHTTYIPGSKFANNWYVMSGDLAIPEDLCLFEKE